MQWRRVHDHDYHMTIRRLSHDHQVTVTWLSHEICTMSRIYRDTYGTIWVQVLTLMVWVRVNGTWMEWRLSGILKWMWYTSQCVKMLWSDIWWRTVECGPEMLISLDLKLRNVELEMSIPRKPLPKSPDAPICYWCITCHVHCPTHNSKEPSVPLVFDRAGIGHQIMRGSSSKLWR